MTGTRTGTRRAQGGLAYERTGSGAPLVLLHVLGGSKRVWDPVLPTLSAHHDVIAFDLPGFGESPPLPAGRVPSVPAISDALEAELDALGIDAPHLAGSSMGGWIALELAARGRARSVVALSAYGGYTGMEARYARLVTTAYRNAAILARPLADRLLQPVAARAVATWFMHGRGWRLPPDVAADVVRDWADGPAFEAARDWLFSHTATGLERITCPTVIAWGTRDRLLSARQGRRLAAMVPGARFVRLPRGGHVPIDDEPDAVARVILETARSASADPS